MSRHSHKEIERIKRVASKMTLGTGEAKAHSLHRLVRGERQNPLYMNTKCNCCGTPLVRAVEIGLCAHCCDVVVADKKRMDWLLANSHIKVGEIYLTSRESLDAAIASNAPADLPRSKDVARDSGTGSANSG